MCRTEESSEAGSFLSVFTLKEGLGDEGQGREMLTGTLFVGLHFKN